MLTGETEILGHKPAPETRYQPQIPHLLAWNQTQCLQQEAGDCVSQGKRFSYSAMIHAIGTWHVTYSFY